MDNMCCKKYFGASNSADGFVNYFPRIFNKESCSRIYVVKGGPGTGKSRFMRDVADEAERRGMSVRYYYCSSDSSSLDGIIIEDIRVGFVDGTAPHVYEPTQVGSFEQILNLGDFWDERALFQKREQIEMLVKEKSDAYGRAYALLSAYGKLMSAAESLTEPCVNHKKLASAVKRWLHKLPTEGNHSVEIALRGAVGMNGKTRFDTYEKEAKMIFAVFDYYGSAHFVMKAIYNEALERGMAVKISYDPVMKDRIEAMLLSDCGILFACGIDGEYKINSKRFVDEIEFKNRKDTVKKLENEAKNIESLVLTAFEEIREYHFALEEIYASTMDFGRKESFTHDFIKKLFQ